jgi:hypothetical protein
MATPEYVPRKEFEQRHSEVLVTLEGLRGEINGMRAEHERVFTSLGDGATKMETLTKQLGKVETSLASYKTLVPLVSVLTGVIGFLIAYIIH